MSSSPHYSISFMSCLVCLQYVLILYCSSTSWLALTPKHPLKFRKLCPGNWGSDKNPYPNPRVLTTLLELVKLEINIKLLYLSDFYFWTHLWQLWQTVEGLLTAGRKVVRQLVEQKRAGELLLWKAVCPFTSAFLQWEQNICPDKGCRMGNVCASVAGVTEKTEPILKSSCQKAQRLLAKIMSWTHQILTLRSHITHFYQYS